MGVAENYSYYNPAILKILDAPLLMKTIDTVSSCFRKDGIGASKNSAPLVDLKHEDLFWERASWILFTKGTPVHCLLLH